MAVGRYRENCKNEKRRSILKGEFTVKNMISSFYSNYSSPFLYISVKHCGYQSKGGFCYLRGLDKGRYWNTLSQLAKQVSLRRSEAKNILEAIGGFSPAIDSSTLCIHVRGKSSDSAVMTKKTLSISDFMITFEPMMDFLCSIDSVTRINTVRYFSAWNLHSVFHQILARPEYKSGFQWLHMRNISFIHGSDHIHGSTISVGLKNAVSSTTSAYRSISKLTQIENVLTDIFGMSRCKWLLLEEALGYGTFAGVSVLVGGMSYCPRSFNLRPEIITSPRTMISKSIKTGIGWKSRKSRAGKCTARQRYQRPIHQIMCSSNTSDIYDVHALPRVNPWTSDNEMHLKRLKPNNSLRQGNRYSLEHMLTTYLMTN